MDDPARTTGLTTALVIAVLIAGLLLVLTACTGGSVAGPDLDVDPSTAADLPTSRTITLVPMPEDPPPSGTMLADMRQSSLDAARGEIQVWVDNDTEADETPTSIRYVDPRLRRPLVAGRLRLQRAQTQIGFPLTLPASPRCDVVSPAGVGRLTVRTATGAVYRTQVGDETDVVGRYVAARCAELALRRVVDVAWDPVVADPADGDVVEGATGHLRLVLTPTGRAGTVVVDSVGGSHLLGSATGEPWLPALEVSGTDGPSTLDLPLRPARCDDHAFMEGGNATAFRIGFTVDGEPGQLLLRMDDDGNAAAISFARAACGY